MRVFNADPQVVAVGSEYLRIVSWNFLASGVLFVSGSVFQGLGNTLPPLGSSTLRLLLFTAIAIPLSHRPGFELRQLWYLSIATVVVQLGLNMWLLRREMGRRLLFEPTALPPPQEAAAS